MGEAAGLEHLVRRYLAAFGPARLAEAANWAGVDVTTLRPAAERLRLATYRDEEGKELLDLPRAPRPGGDVDAPVRFLPTWDATLLVHARRTQILPERFRPRVFDVKTPHSLPTFLVDGAVAGAWRTIEREVAQRSNSSRSSHYHAGSRAPLSTRPSASCASSSRTRFHTPFVPPVDRRDSSIAWLIRDREQAPLAGDAFELGRAFLLEANPGAGDEILEGARREDLARARLRGYSGSNVHGNSGELLSDHLALPSMDSRTDLESQTGDA